MDQVTLPRVTVQQALHVATAAGYPVALIAALKAALEQPKQVEPVATVKVMGSYNGVSALGCLIDASATHVKRGDKLYTHPPRREPLTVTDLQQALVDADLVDPDAIDDPEGFDNGFTLQQIDALHSRLMQTTPPTTTTQPEPK